MFNMYRLPGETARRHSRAVQCLHSDSQIAMYGHHFVRRRGLSGSAEEDSRVSREVSTADEAK